MDGVDIAQWVCIFAGWVILLIIFVANLCHHYDEEHVVKGQKAREDRRKLWRLVKLLFLKEEIRLSRERTKQRIDQGALTTGDFHIRHATELEGQIEELREDEDLKDFFEDLYGKEQEDEEW